MIQLSRTEIRKRVMFTFITLGLASCSSTQTVKKSDVSAVSQAIDLGSLDSLIAKLAEKDPGSSLTVFESSKDYPVLNAIELLGTSKAVTIDGTSFSNIHVFMTENASVGAALRTQLAAQSIGDFMKSGGIFSISDVNPIKIRAGLKSLSEILSMTAKERANLRDFSGATGLALADKGGSKGKCIGAGVSAGGAIAGAAAACALTAGLGCAVAAAAVVPTLTATGELCREYAQSNHHKHSENDPDRDEALSAAKDNESEPNSVVGLGQM